MHLYQKIAVFQSDLNIACFVALDQNIALLEKWMTMDKNGREMDKKMSRWGVVDEEGKKERSGYIGVTRLIYGRMRH